MSTSDEMSSVRAAIEAEPLPGDPAIAQEFKERLVASGLRDAALKVGSMAPRFELPDAYGNRVSLSGILRSGPVVLTFYRGAWCPACNLQLHDLQMNLDRIKALGGNLVAISPQVPDHSLLTQEKNELTFPVLSDVGNVVARAYGIVFEVPEELHQVYQRRGLDFEVIHGTSGHVELPLTATFILAASGVIRYAFVNEDHTIRLNPDEVVQGLALVARSS